MSEAAAASAAEEPRALSTTEGNGPGFLSAVWMTPEAGLAVLTAGADGMVSHRQVRPTQNVKSAKVSNTGSAINTLDVNPARTIAVVGTENRVQLVSLPDLQKKTLLAKFAAPCSCSAWSRDGQTVAVAAEDGCVKLCNADAKVLRTLRTEPFVRGLALDPDGQFVAATVADGAVRIYDLQDSSSNGGNAAAAGANKSPLASSGSSRDENGWTRLRTHTVKVDRDDMTARQGLAWLPDGSGLAVSGSDSDVVLLERLNWKPTAYLAGGHTDAVRVLAFSPNGLYAATGGNDCRVVVWRMAEPPVQVSARQLPHPPSSLAWHPSANMLLCGTTGGSYGLWPNAVPTTTTNTTADGAGAAAGGIPLPSPYKPVDEVDREADAAAAARAAAAADEDDDDDDDDFEGGGGVIRRRGLKKMTAAAADDMAAAAAADDFDDVLDQLDAVLAEAQHNDTAAAAVNPAATSHGLNPGGAGGGRYSYLAAAAPPKPKRPQAPIQPGSTPAAAAAAGAEDEEAVGGGGCQPLQARFLAYNQLGCVVSKAGEGQHFVEVLFRDTSRHRLQPRLTDLFGFTAAALGPRGVAYISSGGSESDEDMPSMLVYRSFDSWCSSDKGWQVALPAGETALVVAAGSSVVAVATSRQVLRLYSLAGRQLSLISLEGPPIALVAAGPADAAVAGSSAAAAAAACQHHLAVVCAQGPPEPLHNTQQLVYTVFDVSRCSRVCGGSVVLSPGSKLTWLAFSTEGLLTAMDSEGTLRVRSPEWGGSWVPVLDAAAAKEGCGSEHVWPVCIDMHSSSLTAVVTSKRAPHPQVLPPPINTQVPLTVLPLAPADAAPPAAASLEQQAMSSRMLAAHLKSLGDADAAAADSAAVLAEAVEAVATESDRVSLKLFNEYCKADKQGRALELLDSMHTVKSLQGAGKLAVHHKFNILAQHIQDYVDSRLLQEQEEAEAAAAAALAAQYQVPHWEQEDDEEAAAGAGSIGHRAADDTDMQAQLDQASQALGGGAAASARPAAAAAAAGSRAGRVPAMFGGAAAGAGAAAGVKRKPAAAGIGAPGAGGSKAGGGGGSVNPFVRRKAK